MENHQYLSNFSDDDVIEFEENNIRRVGSLRALLIWLFEDKDGAEKRLREHLKHNGLNIREYFKFKKADGKEIEQQNFWFDEGVKCNLLRVGSQKWLKGKIKITVNIEFYPDEPQEHREGIGTDESSKNSKPVIDDDYLDGIRRDIGKGVKNSAKVIEDAFQIFKDNK